MKDPEEATVKTLKDGKKMIDFRDLVKAGVHFGHQKSRWSPKMEPYIWGFKNNIHLIDISKTARQLKKASDFLKELATNGKTILWIGTKRPAQAVIFDVATKLKMPYVNHRWIGGTLSNFPQVKKSITKLLHYEDVIARAQKFPHYTKKELNTFQKMVERLEKNIGGIRQLRWPIGAIVVVDVRKEQAAVREAARMGIPVVAIVDTNSDPSLVDYVIPANDDAPRSIELIINYLGEGAEQGLKAFEKKKEQEKQELAKKEAKKEKELPKKEAAPKAKEKIEPQKKEAEKKTVTKKSTEAKKTPAKSATKKTTTKKTSTKSTIAAKATATSKSKTAKSKKK